MGEVYTSCLNSDSLRQIFASISQLLQPMYDNLSSCWGTVTMILLPRAYARGKVIGHVVVVMGTTIAKFGDLGT